MIILLCSVEGITVVKTFCTVQLLSSMEEFISACAKPLAGESPVADAVKDLALPKRQIGKDFDKTTQMGQALLDRLALPIILYEG